MRVNNVSLEAVAVEKNQYPDKNLPEFAFVGRSNVGKSSLINAMINRKALARTSSSPGKTRTINFYNIEELLYFVDLPGYGYAKTSKSESEKWGKMIEGYLKNRETLQCIIMLVDIRHEPSNNDKMMFDWLKYYRTEIVVVATKSDKLSKNEMQKNLAVVRKAFGIKLGEVKVIPFSSLNKSGVEELWNEIESHLDLEDEAESNSEVDMVE